MQIGTILFELTARRYTFWSQFHTTDLLPDRVPLLPLVKARLICNKTKGTANDLHTETSFMICARRKKCSDEFIHLRIEDKEAKWYAWFAQRGKRCKDFFQNMHAENKGNRDAILRYKIQGFNHNFFTRRKKIVGCIHDLREKGRNTKMYSWF